MPMWDGSWGGGGTCQSWLADIKVKYWVQLRVELFYNKPLLKGISAQKLHPRYRWQVEIFFSLISFISHFIFSVYLSIYRNLCGKKWAKCNKMQFFYTFRNNWIKFEYFWKRSIKVGDFVHDALAVTRPWTCMTVSAVPRLVWSLAWPHSHILPRSI